MSADSTPADESFDWVDVESVSTTVFTEEPTLSIYRDGSGNINKSADYQWFKGDDGFVRRADPEARVLGLIPTDGDDVRQINREGDFGGTVGIQKALKILGIDAGELDGTYFTELERHGDVVIADLSDLEGTAADTRTESDRALDATRTSDADENGEPEEDSSDDEVDEDEYQCRHCPDAFDSLQGRKIHEGRVHKGADDEEEEEAQEDEAEDELTPDDVELPGSLTEGDVHAVADFLNSVADVASDFEVSEARAEKILRAYDCFDEVEQ